MLCIRKTGIKNRSNILNSASGIITCNLHPLMCLSVAFYTHIEAIDIIRSPSGKCAIKWYGKCSNETVHFDIPCTYRNWLFEKSIVRSVHAICSPCITVMFHCVITTILFNNHIVFDLHLVYIVYHLKNFRFKTIHCATYFRTTTSNDFVAFCFVWQAQLIIIQ